MQIQIKIINPNNNNNNNSSIIQFKKVSRLQINKKFNYNKKHQIIIKKIKY